MLVKTVLNRVHNVKGFVYQKVRFNEDQIEVELRPRKGSRPICSGCGRPGPGYDTPAADVLRSCHSGPSAFLDLRSPTR